MIGKRLHRFVRAIDAVLKTPAYESKKKFRHRASLLVGDGLSMPFVTADRRQAEIAGVAGLEVIEIGG